MAGKQKASERGPQITSEDNSTFQRNLKSPPAGGIIHISREFWQSFDLRRDYLVMVLYDFVFVFCMFVLTTLGGMAVRWIQSMVSGMGLTGSLQQKSLAELQAIEGSTLTVAGATLAYFVFFFAAIILVFSLFEGLGWSAVLRQHFNKRYFGKMCFLNTLLGLWFIAVLLFISFLRTEDLLVLAQKGSLFSLIGQVVVVTLLIGLFIHPLLVAQVLLTRHPYHSVRASLGAIFSVGYASLFSFVLPYCLGWLVYQVIGLASRFITSYISSDRFALGVLIITAVLYLAWLKLYLSRVILRVSKAEEV